MNLLRNIAIAGFFLWMFIDAAFVFRHATGAAENRDRYSLRLILIGSMLALWVSIGLAFGASGALDSPLVQIAGLATMGIGICVRSTAIVQLGRFHTPNVAVRADHQLMQTGLYKLVRHPSYLGALIAYFGLGLALGNWLSVAVIACITPCIYLYRIHEEDAALLAAFGDPYREYCQRTRRLIPWLY
jgi:protein-S-isoprenylcysteine O-methyltransferase